MLEEDLLRPLFSPFFFSQHITLFLLGSNLKCFGDSSSRRIGEPALMICVPQSGETN